MTMPERCFFCDVQTREDAKRIHENPSFFARYDDFPVSAGHAEIISRRHVSVLTDLMAEEWADLHAFLRDVRECLAENHRPDGFTIGVNEGKAGGQTIPHLHIHLIPRYAGDVGNPRGGIRNIIPGRGDYRDAAIEQGKGNYVE